MFYKGYKNTYDFAKSKRICALGNIVKIVLFYDVYDKWWTKQIAEIDCIIQK